MAITDIDVTSWGTETPQTENIEKIKTNFGIIKDAGGVVSGSGIIVSETPPNPAEVKAYIDPLADDPSAGTTDHSLLTSESRALADQHPISAITGLAIMITRGDGSVVWITTTGAFSVTVPDWANCVYITGVAPGGGANASHGIAGGAGQGVLKRRESVAGGTIISGTMGTKGIGATTYAASPSLAPGTNGGNIVITGILTLYGGYGGGLAPTSEYHPAPPGGANAGRGSIRFKMSDLGSDQYYNGGRGGASIFGPGGDGGGYADGYAGIAEFDGEDAFNPGSGGGGAGTAYVSGSWHITSAGDGADGLLIFEFAYEA